MNRSYSLWFDLGTPRIILLRSLALGSEQAEIEWVSPRKLKHKKLEREREREIRNVAAAKIYIRKWIVKHIYIYIYCSTLAISRGLTRIAEMVVAPVAKKALSPNPKFISELVSLEEEEEEDMDETFSSKSTLVVATVNHEGRLRQPHAHVQR